MPLRSAALALAVWARGAEGLGPEIPAQFSADLEYVGIFGQVPKPATGTGTFFYDRIGKRSRMTVLSTVDYFMPNHTYTSDTLTLARSDGVTSSNTTTDTGENGVCMPSFIVDGKPFEDPFAWVHDSEPAGSGQVHGEACTIFRKSQVTARSFMNYSVCVGADSLPREYNQSGGFGAFVATNCLRLSRFRLESPGDDAFRVTDGCGKYFPRPPCDDSRVGPIDVYRIWGPPEPLALDDKNTGDILGDLAFVCTQGASDTYERKVITHWRVNVSHAFGQYSLCNFDGIRNRCSGPEAQLRTVGRRSGQCQGSGPACGQCGANDDVGSQHSFPSEAKCPPGVAPGAANGCAWGGAVPIRTVPAACVMRERGLLEACSREIGHAPFMRAAGIWAAAFASDDPAKGGCPDAPASLAIVV